MVRLLKLKKLLTFEGLLKEEYNRKQIKQRGGRRWWKCFKFVLTLCMLHRQHLGNDELDLLFKKHYKG